jgi:hypothetical protein
MLGSFRLEGGLSRRIRKGMTMLIVRSALVIGAIAWFSPVHQQSAAERAAALPAAAAGGVALAEHASREQLSRLAAHAALHHVSKTLRP